MPISAVLSPIRGWMVRARLGDFFLLGPAQPRGPLSAPPSSALSCLGAVVLFPSFVTQTDRPTDRPTESASFLLLTRVMAPEQCPGKLLFPLSPSPPPTDFSPLPLPLPLPLPPLMEMSTYFAAPPQPSFPSPPTTTHDGGDDDEKQFGSSFLSSTPPLEGASSGIAQFVLRSGLSR